VWNHVIRAVIRQRFFFFFYKDALPVHGIRRARIPQYDAVAATAELTSTSRISLCVYITGPRTTTQPFHIWMGATVKNKNKKPLEIIRVHDAQKSQFSRTVLCQTTTETKPTAASIVTIVRNRPGILLARDFCGLRAVHVKKKKKTYTGNYVKNRDSQFVGRDDLCRTIVVTRQNDVRSKEYFV
jgi:hypothetical protein